MRVIGVRFIAGERESGRAGKRGTPNWPPDHGAFGVPCDAAFSWQRGKSSSWVFVSHRAHSFEMAAFSTSYAAELAGTK